MLKSAFTALVALTITSSFALAQTKPNLEKIACPTGVTATECGYLSVPESRFSGNGVAQKTIKLFTAIVRSKAPNKFPDPLVFLTGGPGEKAAQYTILAQIFLRYDVVIFDQRGIGLSQPALECPEYNAISEDVSGSASVGDIAVKALETCGARFKTQGIDLSAYNATESAADVNDLRLAYGFDKILLFGVSYGTRLAQEVMRSYPQGLRAVVLDSVIPPQVDRTADTPRSLEESLQKVLKACAADATCNTKYPNLERVLTDLVAKLNAKSVKVTLGGTSSDLDGNGMLGLVLASLYFSQGISEMPNLIYSLSAGKYDVLKGSFVEQFTQAVSDGVTIGAFFSHECRGEIASSSIAALRATYAQFPRWADAIGNSPSVSSERGFAVCAAWGLTTPSGKENEALISDIPTLLMAGEFDPVTPSRYLALASAGLKNATVIEMKGQAHSVSLTNLCGFGIVTQFLSNPSAKLDSSCAAQGKLSFK
jgi:pimeloyl-ACP methyl ester carboxylesterase